MQQLKITQSVTVRNLTVNQYLADINKYPLERVLWHHTRGPTITAGPHFKRMKENDLPKVYLFRGFS